MEEEAGSSDRKASLVYIASSRPAGASNVSLPLKVILLRGGQKDEETENSVRLLC